MSGYGTNGDIVALMAHGDLAPMADMTDDPSVPRGLGREIVSVLKAHVELAGDTDGDGKADFEVGIAGLKKMVPDDFML